MMTTLYNIL